MAEGPRVAPARGLLPRSAVRPAPLVRTRPDPSAFAGVRLHGGIAPGADLFPQTRHGSSRDGGRPDLYGGTRQRRHAWRAGLTGGTGCLGATSESGDGLHATL